MTYHLYRAPYERFYCAPALAPASLVCYCTYFLVAIIPFLLVASTQNLWIPQVEGVEQLDMDFKKSNNFHISVLLWKNADKTYTSYTITNVIQQTAMNNPAQPIYMSSLSVITNKSSKFIQIKILTVMEKLILLKLIWIQYLKMVIKQLMLKQSFSLTISFQQQIFKVLNRQYTKIESRGMLRFRTNNISNVNIGGVVFAGYPQLKIKKPLPRSKYQHLKIYTNNPFSEGWMILDKVYELYYSRDFRLDSVYNTHITAQRGDSFDATNQVNVKILLELDKKQTILYKPTFIHLLREAWVQYFALLLPAIFIGQMFLLFIYKYKFFSTYIQDNLPKNNQIY